MIEGDFDRWTLTNMDAALEEVCRNVPRGEEHAVRKRIAQPIIKCAKSGKTTLSELTAAGQHALNEIGHPQRSTHREPVARSA